MRKANFQFEDGELRVEAPSVAYRLRWQPEAVAEEQALGRDRWTPCWPDFRLLKPLSTNGDNTDDQSGRATAFTAFRAEIPPEVAGAVENFTSYQWPMLEMLSRQSRALDLTVSNPVLAFMLANNNAFRNTKIGPAGIQAAGYSLRKQRFIQAWLGFPDTSAMGKLLRKIPTEEASLPILRRLRNTLEADPDVQQLLSHRQVVNTAILQVVTHAWVMELINPVLLEALETAQPERNWLPIGDMLVEIVRIRQEIAPRRRIPKLKRVEDVEAVYESMTEEYALHCHRLEAQREAQANLARQRKVAMRAVARLERELRRLTASDQQASRRIIAARHYERCREAGVFSAPSGLPRPPIPGTPDIEPICTEAEMVLEGMAQNNCIGSIAKQLVINGGCYFYRVLAPERASLRIAKRTDGCWIRQELKVYGNAKPRDTTINAVDRWLRDYQHSV